jgi:fatty-acid peroxygenase
MLGCAVTGRLGAELRRCGVAAGVSLATRASGTSLDVAKLRAGAPGTRPSACPFAPSPAALEPAPPRAPEAGRPLPRDPLADATLAFMADPYRYIARRCRELVSDVFETRLLLLRTICMTGPTAAELFYDPTRFIRAGAAPQRVQATLFGRDGVQSLDDAAHRHRKRLFMKLTAPESIDRLVGLARSEWIAAAGRWIHRPRIELYREAQEVLTRAVCRWAGVPLGEADVPLRRRELTALFDAAGDAGPRHWWSRLNRGRAEAWVGELVERIRADQAIAPPGSPLHAIAVHRELDGALLSPRVAAVEVLNLLRPTVAVAVYFTFIAHALHERPDLRRRIAAGEEDLVEPFVQEVRRFYPFFPSVVARVRRTFTWQGYRFEAGRRAILDLYGTNHDARAWESPDQFRPERFTQRRPGAFDLIPQGGGEHHVHHRCPGEWITIELMKDAVRLLTRRIDYDLPPQDLRIEFDRLPALPRSRIVLKNVRLARS